MWTLVALFCSVTDLTECTPAVPPFLFKTEEACETFGIREITSIDFDAVTYQFKCVIWGEPT